LSHCIIEVPVEVTSFHKLTTFFYLGIKINIFLYIKKILVVCFVMGYCWLLMNCLIS